MRARTFFLYLGEFIAIFGVCIAIRFAIFYHHHAPPETFIGLDQVLETGVLPVVTRSSVPTYYEYDATSMGFAYELAQALADDLGVRLSVRTVPDCASMLAAVANGEAAIAIPIAPLENPGTNRIRFSQSYMTVEQHLIVHRNNLAVETVEDLKGRTIHLPAGAQIRTLLETVRASGIPMTIVEETDQCMEDLFRKVSQKAIDITIAPDHMARLYRRYYPTAVLAGAVGPPVEMTWAVHPAAHRLRYKLNRFFDRIHQDGSFSAIYDTYYADLDIFDYVDLMKFHKRLRTRLPRYLPHIRKAATTHGFDWRLIVAQAYQESHLNPWARSHARAKGLMQLIPPTAKSLGVTKIFDPAQNVDAGVRQLKMLYDLFDRATGVDRIKIALAAYNVGQGHMLDARNLARKLGKDPNRWYSLQHTLPLLQKRQYYKDAIYGYCRGSEPVKYVRQIFLYYDILRHQSLQEHPPPKGR